MQVSRNGRLGVLRWLTGQEIGWFELLRYHEVSLVRGDAVRDGTWPRTPCTLVYEKPWRRADLEKSGAASTAQGAQGLTCKKRRSSADQG